MKAPVKIIACAALGMFTSGCLFAQPSVNMANFIPSKTYHIGPKSVLKLEGKTNVNGFTCNCTDQFPPQTFSIEFHEENDHSTFFRDTGLKLKIKSLDCGNKLMNKDLQKALNADAHPHIVIELLRVTEDKCNRLTELKDWIKVKALTRITLNDQSNEYWLDITAKKISANRFRFIGVKTFRMSDFGVEPPVALLGMVKVKDDIKISLDLEVTVE